MAKSFCSGCRHWKWCIFQDDVSDDEKFRYCAKFHEFKLAKRKKLCNGKYKE